METAAEASWLQRAAAFDGAEFSVTHLPTPLGLMRAGVRGDCLYFLHFADTPDPYAECALRRCGAVKEDCAGGHAVLAQLRHELAAYFAGSTADFTVKLHMAAHTPFRQAAWALLRRIPFGQTRSYGEQAAIMGVGGNFVRAVGGANGANPFPILVPCHRVIAAGGRLGGYSGGLGRKQALLAHERRILSC